MASGIYNPESEKDNNPIPLWLRWVRTSPSLLIEAESKLLSRLKSTIRSSFVPIFGGACYVRTIVASNPNAAETNPKDSYADFGAKPNQKAADRIPMVLVHGFASGVGLWCKNIDALASQRPVYAFDLLGFGRSSRPTFPVDASEAEDQFVGSIEEWRKAMGLEKFILAGHSLGGYLTACYSLSYPERVAHLILIDPWGFPEAPLDEQQAIGDSKKLWLLRTVRNLVGSANPLSFLRAAGPLGPRIIHGARQDLRCIFDQRDFGVGEEYQVPTKSQESQAKRGFLFSTKSSSSEPDEATVPNESDENKPPSVNGAAKNGENLLNLDGTVALDYIYQINVQHPSGEVGFKSLCSRAVWAKRPLLGRVAQMDRRIPITFIYGSRSWMDMSSGLKTRALRPDSYVDVKIIEGAGHQVYAQAADEFNAYVNAVAEHVDSNDPFNPLGPMDAPRGRFDSASFMSSRLSIDTRLRKRRSSGIDVNSLMHSVASERSDLQQQPQVGRSPDLSKLSDEANDEASDH
ncbi:unnamed protein product [Calicophoron daubneyi]|uniref:AB hydrolase-1 domain-containing protein n=1 Tax=Calicophoron daubneyi TaxID=300641 RepID=A0AAV2T357_CALDB